MREIKFRAWDKVLGMKPVCLIDFTNNAFWVVGDYGNQYELSFDNSPPMQYTGLKDRNGKEIYEGDICNAWYDEDGGYRETGLVEIDPKWGMRIGGRTLIRRGWVEVIGNIYENPELLKHE